MVDPPTQVIETRPPLPPLETRQGQPTRGTPATSGGWKLPVAIFLGVLVIGGAVVTTLLLTRGGGSSPSSASGTPTTSSDPAANPDGGIDDVSIPDPEPEAPPVATPSQDPSRTAAIEGVKTTIREHWRLRLAGDGSSLSAAYSYYTGDLQRRAGREATWIAGIQADGLFEATVRSVRVTSLASARARAVSEIRTGSTATGCKEWVFSYDLVESGGRWLMSRATSDSTPC